MTSRFNQYISTLPNSTISKLFQILILKFLVEIVYIYFIHPKYNYLHFPYNLDIFKYLEGTVILLFLTFSVIKGDESRLSTIALEVILLFLILPTVSYYALAGASRPFTYAFAASFFITIQIPRRLPLVVLKSVIDIDRSPLLIGIVLFTHSTIVLIMVVISKDLQIDALLLLLYDNTSKFRSSINILPLRYAVNWQGKIITPLLVIYFWQKRSWPGVSITIGVSILFFLYNPHKIYLFAILFALIVYYLTARKRLLSGLTITSIIMVTLSLIGYYIFQIFQLRKILFLSTGRMFYAQARIQYLNFEFFKSSPNIYFSNISLIKPILPYTYPYDKSIPYLISNFGTNSSYSANSGYIGNSFAHAGFSGVFLFGMILGIILWILDSAANSRDIKIFVGPAAVSFFMLTQAGLTTGLLTNGILLIMFIILLYIRN